MKIMTISKMVICILILTQVSYLSNTLSSEQIIDDSYIFNDYKTKYSNNYLDDELDQQQPYHSGVLCSGRFAQSFKPTLEIITRVELFIQKGSGGLRISICDNLTDAGSHTLSTIYLEESNIPTGQSWVEFDFPDAVVIPSNEYFILYEPDELMFWEQHLKDPYPYGCSWKYLNNVWEDIADLDFTFKTYGRGHAPINPIITGPQTGVSGTPLFFTLQSTDPDGDNIYYYINWGDDTDSGWIGPYETGEMVTIQHTWDHKGSYSIKSKAKDIYEVESIWSEPFIITVSEPVLEISAISSGFGKILAEIKNVGDAQATSISWSINIKGIVTKPDSTGIIENLNEGESTIIQTPFFIGFGKIEVNVLVTGIEKTAGGTAFGPIILLNS